MTEPEFINTILYFIIQIMPFGHLLISVITMAAISNPFANIDLFDVPLGHNQTQLQHVSVDTDNDDIPDHKDNCIRYYSANINSLRGKIDHIRAISQSYKPAIFALQETKIGPSIASGELDINGYRLYRNDRNTNGGGVAIYALDSLNP